MSSQMIFDFPRAFVYEVVDGDTFKAVVDTGFGNTHKDKFRMIDIDAPEISGELKEQGKLSKSKLEELILQKGVRLRTYGQDKYGRWLCDVWIGETNINEAMVASGHATGYGRYANGQNNTE